MPSLISDIPINEQRLIFNGSRLTRGLLLDLGMQTGCVLTGMSFRITLFDTITLLIVWCLVQ